MDISIVDPKTIPKCLILAQPKSASTSIMKTVGDITGLLYGQQFQTSKPKKNSIAFRVYRKIGHYAGLSIVSDKKFSELFPALDYPALRLGHSDIADFGMAQKSDRAIRFHYDVHKQHFPPTAANIDLFSDVPKIILVRNVADSVASYRRAPVQVRFNQFLDNSTFLKQLEDDLLRWQTGWVNAAQNDKNAIVISYQDLITHPDEVIRKVLDHCDLSIQDGHDFINLASENIPKI